MALLLPAVPALAVDEMPPAAEIRSLISAGKSEEAYQMGTLALEYAPNDPGLLAVASLAAHGAGKADVGLWLATLALDLALNVADDETPDEQLVATLRKRIVEMDPHYEEGSALVDVYASKLLDAADTCRKRKYYVNAVDLLLSCIGTNVTEEANEALNKIYKRKAAEEAILASGMDVPSQRRKMSKTKLARRDAKHRNWGNADEVKSSNYTVITNMGYELAFNIARAMEQMNKFYRQVFQHKTRGGGTARCELKVYKTREEFNTFEDMGDNLSVRGFFVPSEMRVATYDPSTDGRSASALWSTLFHEASHQFTGMLSPGNTLPGWLNEGTASYFEGARLLPSGRVQTNLIPNNRLRNLKIILEHGNPTLEEVLSFFRPGSYPGAYYPVGWGLAYFMQNYEDDKCERVYRRPYQKFLKSYKSGGKHDTFKRFQDIFIKKARVKGVKTFEDFEKVFTGWIMELHSIHFGPKERADQLIEKARKQREFKKYEAALENYQWALRKRPGDAVAAFERAEVLEALKRKDEALFCYRKALSGARVLPNPGEPVPGLPNFTPSSMSSECIARVRKLDKNVATEVLEADQALVDSITKISQGYVKESFPRRAVHILNTTSVLIGGHRALFDAKNEILKNSKLDLRRWKRLTFEDNMKDWYTNEHFHGKDRDWAEGESTSLVFLTARDPLKGPYRYEVVIEPEGRMGKDAVVGLFFGSSNDSPQKQLVVFGSGDVVLAKLEDEGPETIKALSSISRKSLKKIQLVVEVEGNVARFFFYDRPLGEHEFEAGKLEGRVGLVVQNIKAKYSNVRLLSSSFSER